MSYEKLIEQFKSERKKQGLSQEKVAERCDISHSGLVKVERLYREPKISTFMEMCKSIGFMVVMIPIPNELYAPQKEEKPEIIEPIPVNYDDWDNTKPTEEL